MELSVAQNKLEQPRKNHAPKIVGSVILAVILVAAYFFQGPITKFAMDAKQKLTGGKAAELTAETAPAAPTADPAKERDLERYRAVEVIRIALNSYRGEMDDYPGSLDELIPRYLTAIPTDPSDGAPYAYVKTTTGYRLSVIFEKNILAFAAGEHILTPKGFDIPEEAAAPALTKTEDQRQETEEMPAENVEEDAVPAGTPAPEPPASNVDADNDGLGDAEEADLFKTDPQKADTDDDGFNDGDEVFAGYDPLAAGGKLPDADGDGLADVFETARGYDPNNADMDNDGLSDGDELRVYGTGPAVADTDNDGFGDGAEIAGGYEPLGPGRLSPERLADIETRKARFGLHPPAEKE